MKIVITLCAAVGIGTPGVLAYKKSTSHTVCITKVKIMQKVVRMYALSNQHEPGEPIPVTLKQLIGIRGFVLKDPDCPGGGSYRTLGVFPDYSQQFLVCDLKEHALTPPLRE
ncbi:MAG: hypothetical protein QM496_11550 [Verrucomicrobiota bacterium]